MRVFPFSYRILYMAFKLLADSFFVFCFWVCFFLHSVFHHFSVLKFYSINQPKEHIIEIFHNKVMQSYFSWDLTNNLALYLILIIPIESYFLVVLLLDFIPALFHLCKRLRDCTPCYQIRLLTNIFGFFQL